MIRAVFFDIDGTLTDFQTHEVPKEVFPALYALKEQGIRLFIATGRGPDGLKVLKGFPFDGYITLNGQYCYCSDGMVLYENTIEPESIRLLLREIEADPVPCGFQLKDRRVFNFRNELVDEIHAITQNDDAPAGDISGIDREGIYQVMIFMNEQKEANLLKKLPNCTSARWYPTFFDLSPKGGTKVKGIDAFLKYCGIPLEDTMAFGDGGNDLEMLKHVRHSVVMGNASDAVKEAAEYVTSASGDHGIVRALRHYGLLL